jgi:hypothetical protein
MQKTAFAVAMALPFLGMSQAHVPGQLIIQLPPQVPVSAFVQDLASRGQISPDAVTERQISKALNAWLIDFNATGISENEMLGIANANRFVTIAQFNHYVTYRKNPNDLSYGSQWNLHNTGQDGGTPDADIDADDAWDITTGGLTALGDTIVVAVVDGGVDQDHEDLVGNLWRNYADPHNGTDDDNNGLVDDFYGWDFYDGDDGLDPDYHGTPIATIIGARGDNATGIAGINWNVKIMGVAGPQDLGHPNIAMAEAGVIESYSYILEFRKKYNATNGAEGAFVVAVNSSWGIDQGDPAEAPLWCAMYDSMGVAGILNCAATANVNWDIDVELDLPTACASDYLISVTNTNRFDQKVFSAGYGDSTIDLGAPGEDAYAGYPGNWYAGFGGTSGATPHVAGAVGLVYATLCTDFAQFARSDPAGAALAVKQFILDGVDPILDLQGKTVSGGRLNVYQSLVGAENYGTCIYTGITDKQAREVLDISPNPADNLITVAYHDYGLEPATIVIVNVLGQRVRIVTTSPSHPGEHALQISIGDLPPGVYFVYLERGLSQSEQHKLVIH